MVVPWRDGICHLLAPCPALSTRLPAGSKMPLQGGNIHGLVVARIQNTDWCPVIVPLHR